MRRRRKRGHRQKDPGELNIMPFMNLMVILLPFLLITAVFSRTAVLELNLPGPSSQESAQPDFALEITLRSDRIEVGDRTTGLLTELESGASGYDLEGLSAYLMQVKVRFPDKVDATLLVEPQVSYEAVVHVMDAVRSTPMNQGGAQVAAELFPEIAIGDATADVLGVGGPSGPIAAEAAPATAARDQD
jgi:biopolymer transport protein ExbD